ncbi:MAG TPA: cyclase family protein, partial [Pyrinomonadaceae bacterium]|nr:cyclase family protein [Pyrinomonadaceae bacterium]
MCLTLLQIPCTTTAGAGRSVPLPLMLPYPEAVSQEANQYRRQRCLLHISYVRARRHKEHIVDTSRSRPLRYALAVSHNLMRIYDISVNVSEHTPVYPGDPTISVEAAAALSRGDVANVSRLHFSAHTGTHLDAPAHFIEGAPQLWTLPLDTLIGTARVVTVPEDVYAIDATHL